MRLSISLPVIALIGTVGLGFFSANANAGCDVQTLLITKVEQDLGKQGLKLNQVDQISLREDGRYVVHFHYRGVVKFMGTQKIVPDDDGSVALKVDEQSCVAKAPLEK